MSMQRIMIKLRKGIEKLAQTKKKKEEEEEEEEQASSSKASGRPVSPVVNGFC